MIKFIQYASGGDVCLFDYQTASPITQDKSIIAGSLIEISSIINNNANVELDAGDCIELNISNS